MSRQRPKTLKRRHLLASPCQVSGRCRTTAKTPDAGDSPHRADHRRGCRVRPRSSRSAHRPQRTFAFKIGVNPITFVRWEHGRSTPNDQASWTRILICCWATPPAIRRRPTVLHMGECAPQHPYEDTSARWAQITAPLSTQLWRGLSEQNENAVMLETAINRARRARVAAARRGWRRTMSASRSDHTALTVRTHWASSSTRRRCCGSWGTRRPKSEQSRCHRRTDLLRHRRGRRRYRGAGLGRAPVAARRGAGLHRHVAIVGRSD